MKRVLATVLCVCAMATMPALSQVKMTKEQMLFYTSDWKGERFSDGRPKVPDDLLKRAVDISIEDIWDYLQDKGYRCQFEGGWQALHIDKPFAGRALTAQILQGFENDKMDRTRSEGSDAAQAWAKEHTDALDRTRSFLDELERSGDLSIAKLTLANSQIHELASGH